MNRRSRLHARWMMRILAAWIGVWLTCVTATASAVPGILGESWSWNRGRWMVGLIVGSPVAAAAVAALKGRWWTLVLVPLGVWLLLSRPGSLNEFTTWDSVLVIVGIVVFPIAAIVAAFMSARPKSLWTYLQPTELHPKGPPAS